MDASDQSLEFLIRKHVDILAGVIGIRTFAGRAGALEVAARYVEHAFEAVGVQWTADVFNCNGKLARTGKSRRGTEKNRFVRERTVSGTEKNGAGTGKNR
jgi:hypothetical protein